MRRLTLVILSLFLALSAQAAKLQKYKDWLRSPAAYFLTGDERKEWKNVRTDDEAAAFVAAFVEKRGGASFIAAIDERAAIADKYFTLPKVKGTETLRGKLVILFGRPLDIKASKALEADNQPFKPEEPPPGVSDLSQAGSTRTKVVHGKGRRMVRYTLIFPAGSLPAFRGKDYAVDVDVDLSTGKETLSYGVDSREVDALIAAAIAGAIGR
jgi:GWxTD domain-containing protein